MPLAKKRSGTLGHSEYEQEPQKRIRTSPISNPAHRYDFYDFPTPEFTMSQPSGSTSIAMYTSFTHGISNTFSRFGLGNSERRKNDAPQYKAHPPIPPVNEEQIDYNRLQQDEARIDPSSRLFQDKLDLCSESEIIGDCDTLNSKIREAALTLIDDWEKSLSLSRKRRNLLTDKARVHLKSTLGKNIYTSIRQLSSPHVQIPMTDALQGLAASVAFGIISKQLCPGLPYEVDQCMRKTFKHMLTAGTLSLKILFSFYI